MLSGKNEIALDINAESIRLITNAVTFYNATILSRLYEHYLSIYPMKASNIARLSPVAWRPIWTNELIRTEIYFFGIKFHLNRYLLVSQIEIQ